LDKVLNLRGVSFTWNKQLSPYVGRRKDVDIGLIAQEVEEIIPEIVQETSIPNLDFQIKNVDYDRLVPVLVEAIKEQQKQIEDLKETVSKLSTPSEKVQGVCYDT
jgi:DNA-binding NtrC family response regulator